MIVFLFFSEHNLIVTAEELLLRMINICSPIFQFPFLGLQPKGKYRPGFSQIRVDIKTVVLSIGLLQKMTHLG